MTNKEFVKQYIPFSTLKKVGFFDKKMKFNDYDAITKRVLDYYGQTMEQYIESRPYISPQVHPGIITGHGRYTVGENGELQTNGFKITLTKGKDWY